MRGMGKFKGQHAGRRRKFELVGIALGLLLVISQTIGLAISASASGSRDRTGAITNTTISHGDSTKVTADRTRTGPTTAPQPAPGTIRTSGSQGANVQPVSAGLLDVGYTLEGCNLDRGGTFSPIAITCSDDAYTTGNLGKSWAELDLVPMRVTLDNGSASTQSGNFVVAGDYKNGAGTATGWDYISALTLDAAKSDSGCPSVTSGAVTITPPGGGAGGADQTIYRTITGSIPANKTCVYDYYMRLALGAHLFSGSSLQANLWNESLTSSGIGQKRVSIPVNEIAPQQLSKTMTASEGTGFVWNISKSVEPRQLVFANSCSTDGSSQGVSVTVSWTKQELASGNILVATDITVTNPAHRPVDATVTDTIYEGIDQTKKAIPLSGDNPKTFDTQTVPAGGSVVLHHEIEVASGPTQFNDVAEATYFDPVVPDVTIPGNTQATASATVQAVPSDANSTVTITDTEEITGTDLGFSVDSVSLAGGTFDGGYTLGTETTGPLTWSSSPQSDSGSVTFNKTVYVDKPSSTSGILSDDAQVIGDGQTVLDEASASVDISAGATVSLTIDKTIPDVLQGDETQDFVFDISGPNDYSNQVTQSFAAGDTHKSTTLSGLEPGSYTVSEKTATGWLASPLAQTIDLNLPTCSGTASFANSPVGASAQVHKVTDPAGFEQGWEFTLTGPNVNETGTTNSDGNLTFASVLQEGTYTITETGQSGWTLTDITQGQQSVKECSFTVDLPADADQVFGCTFTNTQNEAPPGTITVNKVLKPSNDPGLFDLWVGEKKVATAVGNGEGGSTDVAPGTYTVSESASAGTSLSNYTSSIDCGVYVEDLFVSLFSGSAASLPGITIESGQHIFCTITNTRKVTPPPPTPPLGIQIVKGGPALAHVGDTITYTFAVTTTTSTPLTNVTVTDPVCDSAPTLVSKDGGNTDDTLSTGETWNYSCTHVVTASDPDPLPNTATATGKDSLGRTASDVDSHLVDIIHPAIQVVKSANPTSGAPGETVTYTYKVTNIGDVDLFNVSVDDDVLGHIGDIATLAVGQTVTLKADYVIPDTAGAIKNVVVAAGKDETGFPVRDDDRASIDVVLGTTVTKTTTPPSGVAFTGTSAAIPLAGLALLLLLIGSGLVWVGARRRGESEA